MSNRRVLLSFSVEVRYSFSICHHLPLFEADSSKTSGHNIPAEPGEHAKSYSRIVWITVGCSYFFVVLR